MGGSRCKNWCCEHKMAEEQHNEQTEDIPRPRAAHSYARGALCPNEKAVERGRYQGTSSIRDQLYGSEVGSTR